MIFHAVYSRDQKRISEERIQASNTKIPFLTDHIFIGIIFLDEQSAAVLEYNPYLWFVLPSSKLTGSMPLASEIDWLAV